MDPDSTATPQWMKWKDLSCPDSHYLITVLSAFSFSLKMFGSVRELKITFTPRWQSQVFCGYSQVLCFYVLYMLHSASVTSTAPGRSGQEAWGMRNRSLSLLSVSSTSQSEEDALAFLFFVSRSCTCKYLCVSGARRVSECGKLLAAVAWLVLHQLWQTAAWGVRHAPDLLPAAPPTPPHQLPLPGSGRAPPLSWGCSNWNTLSCIFLFFVPFLSRNFEVTD